MRHLGSIEDRQLAYRFHDYMLVRGVATKIDEEGAEWSLWVVDEDQVDAAREELEAFLRSPDEAKYVEAATAARDVRKEGERRDRQFRKQHRDLGRRWQRGENVYVTMTFMVLCVATTIVATDFSQGVFDLSNRNSVVRWLSIQEYRVRGNMIEWWPGYSSITSGQVWRLVTPALLHGGLLHLFFNVYMLRQFGTALEFRKGPWFLLTLILLLAVGSNVTQYQLGGQPNFLGFSGVNYGLFGFIWMRGHFRPRDGLAAPQPLVVVMMVWFLLCWADLLGPIANWAHTGGLVLGGVLGALPFKRL